MQIKFINDPLNSRSSSTKSIKAHKNNRSISDVLEHKNNIPIVQRIINAIPEHSQLVSKARIQLPTPTSTSVTTSTTPIQFSDDYVKMIAPTESQQQEINELYKKFTTDTIVRLYNEPPFEIGTLFYGKWKINRFIAQGADGSAYLVSHKFHPEINGIIKIEPDGYGVNNESLIYTHLDEQVRKGVITPEDRRRFPTLMDILMYASLNTMDRKDQYEPRKRTYLAIVMTKVEARSVDDYIKNYAPRDIEYVKLLRGWIDVLLRLHKAGVVHHDCHHGNTFMGHFDQNDPDGIFKLQLIDFGRSTIVSKYRMIVKLQRMFIDDGPSNLTSFSMQKFKYRRDAEVPYGDITQEEMYYYDYIFVIFVFFGVTMGDVRYYNLLSEPRLSSVRQYMQNAFNVHFFNKFKPHSYDNDRYMSADHELIDSVSVDDFARELLKKLDEDIASGVFT